MKDRNLPHSDNWATPKYFYDPLNDEFDFDFDPCPLEYGEITPDKDGLLIEWGKRNFCNPPYSKDLKPKFIQKAIEESKKGKLCVMLLPVSTSTKLFHDIILPNITEPIRFVKGRIKFIGHNSKGELQSKGSPMHDSMVVIFDGRKLNKGKLNYPKDFNPNN
jgi:hypothetical protein